MDDAFRGLTRPEGADLVARNRALHRLLVDGVTVEYQQFQTYMAEIPSLFATNALLVISDGVKARVGTLTAGREWFKPWRTIAGEDLADPYMPQLQVVIWRKAIVSIRPLGRIGRPLL